MFVIFRKKIMLKIDIHTHILPENLNSLTNTFSDPRFLRMDPIDDKTAMLLKDNKPFRRVDCNCWSHQARMEECEESGVNLQVLSTIPALFSYWSKDNECLELSQFLNNHIANLSQENPSKYIGLGTIPMQNPDLAIQEMDRCINKLNLPGIQMGSNINGLNLSETLFTPIFEHAEKIGCSIFIHPWEMMGQSDIEKYWLPWLVGMPAETSRAICSLIFGGVFERYPNLKIAFAHGGGAFPFTAGRVDHGFNVRPDLCAMDNSILPSSYMKNFYVDSLVHSENAMKFLIETMGVERIALGSDYPFPLGEHHPGKLIESMGLPNSAKQRLLSGTAFEWLGLNEKIFFI
jgi:aminocarboxymuconate-semialdehyde decarboxylase